MSTSGSASTPSGAYSDVHRRSLEDPERFWLNAARDIDWTRAPRQALDDSRAPLYRWFSDGSSTRAGTRAKCCGLSPMG